MARFLVKSVLISSVLIWCLLAGKGEARPSDENVSDYVNDDYDNYDGEDDDSPDRGNEAEDEAYTGPPPVIRGSALNITVAPGTTVYLPCDTENAVSFATIWMNNTSFLWTDTIKVTKDPRLHKYGNNTVRITNVGPDDSGTYTCEISAQPVVKLVHTLHVPSAARIIEMTPKKTILMKGDSLTLECIVSGYPKPSITWMRKNKRLPSGENTLEATSITIDKVNRHHEGTYQCTASNGLGKPAHQTVTIHVHYAPEISIEKETVNTAEGVESELTCTVHAEPKATVEWFHNGSPVEPSTHTAITKEGGRNILRLANTKKNDFGSYTCKAMNSIGTNEKVVKLSGLPIQPMFIAGMPDNEGTSEMLEWTVESSSPITEYELKYRKEKMPWDMSSPVVENPEGNKYTVKHKLESLSPGKYEVYIRAKNTYGWSEPSKVHPFSADSVKGDAAANSAEPSSANAAEDSRPRIFALLTVLSLSVLFL